MTASFGSNPDQQQKDAFVSNIESKLIEKQDRLSYIKRKVKKAVESNRIQVSEQLLKAELLADTSFELLRKQLELLEKADDESWSSRRYEVEAAWDDLSQAIKKVVARFP